jgi:hypothetical protein
MMAETKKDLFKYVISMKDLLLTALSCLLASISYAQVCFFQVDFQDVFREDTVSFWVNGQTVFSNQILTNDPNLGVTDMILTFVSIYEGSYSVRVLPGARYQVEPWITLRDIPDPNVLRLNIKVNELEHEEIVDLAKGRFIGITTMNEKMNDGIFINQWTRPFFYD